MWPHNETVFNEVTSMMELGAGQKAVSAWIPTWTPLIGHCVVEINKHVVDWLLCFPLRKSIVKFSFDAFKRRLQVMPINGCKFNKLITFARVIWENYWFLRFCSHLVDKDRTVWHFDPHQSNTAQFYICHLLLSNLFTNVLFFAWPFSSA